MDAWMLSVKLLALVALLLTSFSSAADCTITEGSCMQTHKDRDETSLLQVNKAVKLGSGRSEDTRQAPMDGLAMQPQPIGNGGMQGGAGPFGMELPVGALGGAPANVMNAVQGDSMLQPIMANAPQNAFEDPSAFGMAPGDAGMVFPGVATPAMPGAEQDGLDAEAGMMQSLAAAGMMQDRQAAESAMAPVLNADLLKLLEPLNPERSAPGGPGVAAEDGLPGMQNQGMPGMVLAQPGMQPPGMPGIQQSGMPEMQNQGIPGMVLAQPGMQPPGMPGMQPGVPGMQPPGVPGVLSPGSPAPQDMLAGAGNAAASQVGMPGAVPGAASQQMLPMMPQQIPQQMPPPVMFLPPGFNVPGALPPYPEDSPARVPDTLPDAMDEETSKREEIKKTLKQELKDKEEEERARKEKERAQKEEIARREAEKKEMAKSTEQVVHRAVDRAVEMLREKKNADESKKKASEAAAAHEAAAQEALRQRQEQWSRIEAAKQAAAKKARTEVLREVTANRKQRAIQEKARVGTEDTLSQLAQSERETAERAAASNTASEKQERAISMSAAKRAAAQKVAAEAQGVVARAAAQTAAAQKAAAAAEMVVVELSQKQAREQRGAR